MAPSIRTCVYSFQGVYVGLFSLGLSVPPNGMVCKVMGVLYQLEECMTLGIIIRMAQHPFKFMLKREDMNEYVRPLPLHPFVHVTISIGRPPLTIDPNPTPSPYFL